MTDANTQGQQGRPASGQGASANPDQDTQRVGDTGGLVAEEESAKLHGDPAEEVLGEPDMAPLDSEQRPGQAGEARPEPTTR